MTSRPRRAARARRRPCRARRSGAPGCVGRGRTRVGEHAAGPSWHGLRQSASFGTLNSWVRACAARTCARARESMDCRDDRGAPNGTLKRNMSKSLIIAEKPSVAQDIVRALTPSAGKFDKHDEHFENERYVVTSAVGHLVEIKAPEEFDVKRGKWSFAHLPVIPPHFDLKPIDKTKSRLNAVVRQSKRKDVSRTDQRLRRGPRGRADLSPDRAVRAAGQGQARQAGAAPVAAEHDAGGDPRRLRAAAQRQADAGAGRRRALPLRGRLAGRHQRHARDDGLQLARRRLLPDHRRPGADADAVRWWSSARRRSASTSRATTGRCTPPSTPQAGQYDGKWFDPKFKKDDDAERRADRLWIERDAQAIADAVRGQPATVTEEAKPSTQAQPAAVRPDHLAARGQLALRLLGQDHAVARAGAVREAQGADLPADRFARAARGLRRRGQADDEDDRQRRPARPAARTGAACAQGAEAKAT